MMSEDQIEDHIEDGKGGLFRIIIDAESVAIYNGKTFEEVFIWREVM